MKDKGGGRRSHRDRNTESETIDCLRARDWAIHEIQRGIPSNERGAFRGQPVSRQPFVGDGEPIANN